MQREFVTFLIAATLVVASVQGSPAPTPMSARCVITSPDHPGTWDVGTNDKLSQELQWDAASRMLLLDIVYAYVPYSQRWIPRDQRRYDVRFPSVQVDGKTGILYLAGKSGEKIVIGSLEGKPPNPRVRLRENVEVVAHRRYGRIDAKLIVH